MCVWEGNMEVDRNPRFIFSPSIITLYVTWDELLNQTFSKGTSVSMSAIPLF